MKIKLHPQFELNGTSFKTIEELILFSKSVSPSIHMFLQFFFDEADSVKLQTSGSTGAPKIIEIKKEFMLNSAKATGAYFDLKENTTSLLCMNPDFIAGKMMLVRAMVLGWKLDVAAPSLNPLKEFNKSYDFSAMVPIQVSNSLKELHKVKKLIIGGGAVSNTLQQSLQKIKTECFATYGMTETVSHIAVRKLNNFRHAELVSASHYKTLTNISISKDKRNCLIIDAPKIAEKQIITNDIVELTSKTSFKWLGRFDNIINSGGIKLIPEQIEEKLSKIIEQRFFVAGIPDELLGEKLVLIVEDQRCKGTKEQRDKVEIRKNVISNAMRNLMTLNKFETPKEIYFIDRFVETSTRKIHRKKTLEFLFPNS